MTRYSFDDASHVCSSLQVAFGASTISRCFVTFWGLAWAWGDRIPWTCPGQEDEGWNENGAQYGLCAMDFDSVCKLECCLHRHVNMDRINMLFTIFPGKILLLLLGNEIYSVLARNIDSGNNNQSARKGGKTCKLVTQLHIYSSLISKFTLHPSVSITMSSMKLE